jgi:hypothetical protein
MWYAFSRAFNAAAIGRLESEAHGFSFSSLGVDNDVKITLPDGHVLYYRGLEVHYDEKNRVQIMRDGKAMHGGLITENICQAVCARLLYRALVNCEKAGLETVLHVYDSIMIEAETRIATNKAAQLHEIMCTPPKWAPDLKLAVDIHIGKRWTKE